MSCSFLVPKFPNLRCVMKERRRAQELAAQKVEVEHAI